MKPGICLKLNLSVLLYMYFKFINSLELDPPFPRLGVMSTCRGWDPFRTLYVRNIPISSHEGTQKIALSFFIMTLP